MERKTIHYVYVPGNYIRQPFSITNEVAARLSQRYEVVIHDWEATETIQPKPGDILLGHPNPEDGRTFANSFHQPGWAKRIPLIPFCFGLSRFSVIIDRFLDPLVREADCLLAICGKYWAQTLPQSVFSHWQSKFIQVDLAVRRDHFPFVKDRIAEKGKRRFVYIGSAVDYKGTDFLAALARANKDLSFGWIGRAPREYENITNHGQLDFADPAAVEIIKSYDFLLTCGRSDANPTTILEAAAWGLIPVCTPQSGYIGEDWFANIPLDDVAGASRVLQTLVAQDEGKLREMQAAGLAALDRHYNWDRFAQQVIDAIESPPLPTCSDWEFQRRKNQLRLLPYRTKMQAIATATRARRLIGRSARSLGLMPRSG